MDKEFKERLEKETVYKGKISRETFDKMCKEEPSGLYKASASEPHKIALFTKLKMVDDKIAVAERTWRFDLK